MAARKSLLGTSVLLLCLVIANIHQTEAQCGFQDFCQDYAIGSDGVFSANCRNGAGATVAASINLDSYISNSNGNLVDGTDFSASCESLGWANEKEPNVAFYIIGQCKKGDQSLRYASYDISFHVVNNDGVLAWSNC